MPTPAAPRRDPRRPLPAADTGARPAVGFALTTAERRLFFTGAEAAALPARAHWFGEDELAPGAWERALRDLAPAVVVTGWRTPPLPAAWLDEPACPLRYVCHVTGSVRAVVPRSFVARGGLVTNWGALASPQVAEHALLLALSALRNQGRWREFISLPPGERRLDQLGTRTLFGRRVGVHGFGGVARALLPLLRPFNVHVSVFATVPSSLVVAAGARPCASLEALFAGSDVLFECEALTPATAGLVSAPLLAALPNGAVFVNVGRGGVVDEAALVHESRTGRIRLALDVAQSEPLTPASAITQLPDAIVSPHIGGPTLDRYADCGALALSNLRRFLAGEAPEGVITPEIYDRST
ncbi:MAG: hydroxyacid dehydrogenase [Verrucomicrobia bacterium]|nr:hydroxyacid dehydrogenase [Verrucomicrobiota bacterium]